MKVLYSMKDMKNIISSLDMKDKGVLLGRFHHVADGYMKGYLKGNRMAMTEEWFLTLLDGSYGQFVLSNRMDVMVCSLGKISLYSSDETPYYGNYIRIFVHEGQYADWYPLESIYMENTYMEDEAFRPDTVKRITNLTKICMKKFAAVIDSVGEVEKLADILKKKYR